ENIVGDLLEAENIVGDLLEAENIVGDLLEAENIVGDLLERCHSSLVSIQSSHTHNSCNQNSSTNPAATKEDATRAPPSTRSRVMPRSDRACSTAARSNPVGVDAMRMTCAPAAPSIAAAGASAKFEVTIQSGVLRAEWTRRLLPGIRNA